jgi:hypothetical protein
MLHNCPDEGNTVKCKWGEDRWRVKTARHFAFTFALKYHLILRHSCDPSLMNMQLDAEYNVEDVEGIQELDGPSIVR